MQGLLPKQWTAIYRCGIPFKGCAFQVKLDALDAQVLAAVGRTLEPLTSDPRMAARLRAAWKRLQTPERKGDGQRRVHALEQVIEKARKRLDAAMDSLLDGAIDKAAYDRAVERYTADADAATAELASLRKPDTAPVLPDLETVLRDADSWQQILTGADLAAQRNVLAMLIERVVPERIGRGRYQTTVIWTPLGSALSRLTEATGAAPEHGSIQGI
jgi:hypothetical protein